MAKHIFRLNAAILAVLISIAAWLWVIWPERTLNRFLTLVRDGDMQAAHQMLDSYDADVYFLDDDALKLLAERHPEFDRRTLVDVLQGCCRISAQLAYSNNHSITVERGRVFLGGSYYIYLVPGPPNELLRVQEESDASD